VLKEISTQQSYPLLGRPDIEIITENSIILIENKVDSSEGFEQLSRYIKILSLSNKKNKYLVYLTKYYEHKDLKLEDILYLNIKWWDVGNIISYKNTPITEIFSEYLTENRLSMDKNFKSIDLVSLDNIANAISKMDEVIDLVKEDFTQKLGAFSKNSSRSTRLCSNAYYNFKIFGEPLKFSIDIGYFWWWNDQNIYLGIRIWIPNKTNEKDDIINFFKANLVNWEKEEWGKTLSFGMYKNMNEIIGSESEQVPTMINFLKSNIDQIHKLKIITPQFFE
jgi:hypothetical protein